MYEKNLSVSLFEHKLKAAFLIILGDTSNSRFHETEENGYYIYIADS